MSDEFNRYYVGDSKRIALPLRVAGGAGIRPVRSGKCG